MTDQRPSQPATQTGQPHDRPQWNIASSGETATLRLSGQWTVDDGVPLELPADALTKAAHGASHLSIDTSGLGQWDSSLVSFLWNARQSTEKAGLAFDTTHLPDGVQRLIALLPPAPQPPATPHAHVPNPFQDAGAFTIASLEEVGAVTLLGVDTAKGSAKALSGHGGMRLRDLLTNISDAGPSALLIVLVVNFLVGAILAFVGAVQLQKFSADIYVANLVGIACVRELAAVMTAIIMAGRTGGAYAARIATMLGNEEIDALQVFGIPISSYILLPSVLALMLMMPLLYLYGCLASILGGYTVAVVMLPDITGTGYLHQTWDAVDLHQFEFGFIKSIVFATMIGLTSCRIGLKAGRSAADVGTAATSAVVVGIVGVIALDAVFAVIADVIGI
ncbi:ABC transporter permease [Acetobacter estunensis]|uniref:ABC transporter permease n=1 Tax=Acetobacter estunensis TaxID=104097 RepID=UPI001C2D0A22|nr:ABC transporter permease [Acetobacter estunensis]MBV1836346.1 ABC transporter permease [Acetobacter estunensis]